MPRALRPRFPFPLRWVTALCLVAAFAAARAARAEEPASAPAPGKALYAQYCQLCHGVNATGYAADHAPSLVSATFLGSASDAFIASGIRFGRPETAMAAYGKERGGPLDDTQIAAIVAFLRARGPQAVALPERELKGDGVRGAALFRSQCQSCHGTPKTPGKAPQLQNREFLAAVTPAFLRHAIVKGRPPTRMPAFERKLNTSQIDDIVTWLVSLRPGAPLARAPAVAPAQTGPVVIHPKGKPPEFTLREDRFVSAAQVKQALDTGRRLIIIDARAPSDWLSFHIPGALPIPYYDAGQLDRIPNDGTWVVAYCACPHHASGEVVDALRRRNYPHTAVLDEGILFWRRSGFPLEGTSPKPEDAEPATVKQ